MKDDLMEFLDDYNHQLSEEQWESFVSDINLGIYNDTCELAEDLEIEGIDLDDLN